MFPLSYPHLLPCHFDKWFSLSAITIQTRIILIFYGEVLKAFVVFKECKQLDVEGIFNYVIKNIAKYKCPAEIEVLDALPHNDSGKVLKHTLKPLKVL
ncbi:MULTISPECIES: hypothetical protein [unclassified Lysinibacillus]|uniref:AMP-binding enzyme n=1 Tax=unclassified Lysinibacillus TaxID=2636778 RepID=UPI001F0D7684|nr:MULTISPECIES: hypothetical protein [unclassified Lysinibacillus]